MLIYTPFLLICSSKLSFEEQHVQTKTLRSYLYETFNQLHLYVGTIILTLFPLLAQVAGPGFHKYKLAGHWTFEKGEELKDLTENFPDIQLKGAKLPTAP